MPKYTVSTERRAFAKEQRREMTRAEAMLWQVLRAGRLDGHKFKRQVPFGPYVADFSCARARLIVELDGAPHERANQRARDEARDAWFQARGIATLRIPNDLVLASIELAGQRILDALRAPSPGSLRSPPSPSRGEG